MSTGSLPIHVWFSLSSTAGSSSLLTTSSLKSVVGGEVTSRESVSRSPLLVSVGQEVGVKVRQQAEVQKKSFC